jgi:hypothetical protein
MVDLYLQELMRGPIEHQPAKPRSEASPLQRKIDREITNLADQLASEQMTVGMPFSSLAMKQGELRARLQSEASMVELSGYVTEALEILQREGARYLDPIAEKLVKHGLESASLKLAQLTDLPAEASLRTLLALDEGLFTAIHHVANCKIDEGLIKQALSLLALLTLLDSQQAELWLRLGIAAQLNDNHPLAIRAFAAAQILDQTSLPTQLLMAESLIHEGMVDEASELLTLTAEQLNSSPTAADQRWIELHAQLQELIRHSKASS